MSDEHKNIFVLGLDSFNRRKLESIRGAEGYAFHPLLDANDFVEAESFPIDELLGRARGQIEAFEGSVDAIIAYMDFPVSTMLPILCQGYGLRSASLESVLKCEHKYWSRVEQNEVISEYIPRFATFDPFDEKAGEQIGLPYPLWIKPVKSFGSHLGFRIANRSELGQALSAIRKGLPRLARPFDKILSYARLPERIAAVGGRRCLAETIMSGRQCTLEGARYGGELHIHGVVDSIHEANGKSFNRYEYPSRIPGRIRRAMRNILDRFLRHIDYDNAAFNAEFFWDAPRDRIWLVEVNTRVAQHHSDLFEKVDGVSNQQISVDVALGRRPSFPRREGAFRCAAVFFVRRYRDARVVRAPTEEEVREAEHALPGTVIKVLVKEGMWLSELREEDSYSYACAMIYTGANRSEDLRHNFRRCVKMLPFAFEEGQPKS